MALGGDPADIRAQARAVRRWAEDLTTTRDRVRTGYGTEWVGLAAERHLDRLHQHATHIDEARDELLDVARQLDDLAARLEEIQAAIRRATSIVEDTVSGARSTLGRLAGIARDLLDDGERAASQAAETVLRTVGGSLPAPGSPQWLDLARTLGR